MDPKPVPRLRGRRAPRAGLVLLVVLLTAAGCAGSDGELEPSDPDNVWRGGTLRVAFSLRGMGTSPDLVELVLDSQRFFTHPFGGCCLARTLLAYRGRSLSEGGAQLQPDLALAMPEVSADGLTWRFQLREGLRYAPPFADREIVAQDVITALERTLRIGEAPYFEMIVGVDAFLDGTAGTIAGVRAPDDHTIEFELSEPTGDFGDRVALDYLAPMPAEALDALDGDARLYVSSGPYMLEGSEEIDIADPDAPSPADRDITAGLNLVRNPSWAAEDDPLRPAYVDRIEMRTYADEIDALRALEDGEVDLMLDPLSTDARDARREPGESGARLHDVAALSTFFIPLNLAQPPFDDVAVRRAVAWAVNRAALTDAIDPRRSSAFAPAQHAFPDAIVGGLLRDYAPFATPGSSGDPLRAQAAMRESRYDTDGDGRCDGPVCEIVGNEVGLGPAGTAALVDNLEAIGIRLTFVQEPWMDDPAAHVALAAVFGWGSDYPSPAEFAWLLRDPSDEPGPNVSLLGATSDQLAAWGYEAGSVPSADDQLRACERRSGSAAAACWAEVDQLVTEELVAWIPVARSLSTTLVGERVTAFAMEESGILPALAHVALREGSE